MTSVQSKADSALDEFVIAHEPFIRDKLGDSALGLNVSELQTVTTYIFRLAAVAQLREPRASFEQGLRSRIESHSQPHSKEGLLKAIAWLDQGQILGSQLKDVVLRSLSHSKTVETFLHERRTLLCRASFRRINDVSIELRDELFAVYRLAAEIRKPANADQSLQISQSFKSMRNLVQKLAWHTKAGAAWALSAGYSAEGVEKAVVRLTLNRLDRIVRSAHRIEHQLISKGLREDLVQNIWKRYDGLRVELSDAVMAETGQRKIRNRSNTLGG